MSIFTLPFYCIRRCTSLWMLDRLTHALPDAGALRTTSGTPARGCVCRLKPAHAITAADPTLSRRQWSSSATPGK